MIAIDSNLLIYAHPAAVPEHRRARRAIEKACGDPRGWGISLPSVSEFWSIVTHPAAGGRPSTAEEAAAFLQTLTEQGGMQTWTPGPGFAERLLQLARWTAAESMRCSSRSSGSGSHT